MHEMRRILTIATRHLSRPLRSVLSLGEQESAEWTPLRCSATFTTYDALEYDAQYWRDELPLEEDLLDNYVRDSAWASLGPVAYEDIAHILIPRRFGQEIYESQGPRKPPRFVDQWTHEQDLNGLSELFAKDNIAHYLTAQVLEIKRF